MSTNPQRRLIVHAGWPKTGTTSLQEQLRSYPNLAAQPYNRPSGEEARRANDRLRQAADWEAEELESHLEACWVDPTTPVIYSSEGLVSIPFRDWFKKQEPTAERARRVTTSSWPTSVLLVMRDPKALLRSNYRHSLKAGYSASYATFLERVQADRLAGEGPMAIKSVVATFAELVGSENLHVLRMEDYIGDPNWFWQTVASITDTPALENLRTSPVPMTNVGRSGSVSVLLRLNKMFAAFRVTPRRRAFRLRAHRVASFVARHDDGGWHQQAAILESRVVEEMTNEMEDLRIPRRPDVVGAS